MSKAGISFEEMKSDMLKDEEFKIEYEKLKLELFNKCKPNRDLYTDGKKEFVNEIVNLARKKYKIPVGDFNCGLRGYVTEKIKNLNSEASGVEYATEMLIKASQADLIIGEIPIDFYKDKRNKKSHLRTVRDGIRHLKVIIEKAI